VKLRSQTGTNCTMGLSILFTHTAMFYWLVHVIFGYADNTIVPHATKLMTPSNVGQRLSNVHIFNARHFACLVLLLLRLNVCQLTITSKVNRMTVNLLSRMPANGHQKSTCGEAIGQVLSSA
jgi:uncharacterized membrane protein